MTPESNTPPFGVSLVLACVWHPQTVNVSCDPGKAPSSTGGTCVSCGVGTYSSTGTACEACPAGSVSDTVGKTVRAACVSVPSSTPYPPTCLGRSMHVEYISVCGVAIVVLGDVCVCGAAAVVPLLRLTLALPVPKSEPTAASTSGVLHLYAWMVCKGWREV